MRKLVESQVRYAFRAIGDLAEGITLHPKNTSGFNVATMEVTSTALPDKTVKAVFIEETKIKGAVAELMFIASDVEDLNSYATAVRNGITYHLVFPFVTNGYTTNVGLSNGQV